DGRLRPRRVTDVMANGVKPVFEVRTAQGKRIVATDNHPFRTLDGWTLLRDLKVGDRVAAARELRIASPEPELVLAGAGATGNNLECGGMPPLWDVSEVSTSAGPWTSGASSEKEAKIPKRRHAAALQTRHRTGDAPDEQDVFWDRIVAIEPCGEE